MLDGSKVQVDQMIQQAGYRYAAGAGYEAA
jgi:hypothetical protein